MRQLITSSRSKFISYNRLNTCPICTSSSGKCKWQNYELSAQNGKITATIKTFCMTGAGGYGHPDYHYFNDTRDGQWGVYIPLHDWNEHRGENTQATQQQREQWLKEQQLKQQQLLDAENQRKAGSLPALERDIAARAILAQLSLNEIDRQDLIRRGFTAQQIREIGFKSVEKFQRLKDPVNNRFPGISISGNRLNTTIGGILIPVYTITGEIVAFQIRNREQSKSRYRWLSSVWERGRDNGNAPNLPNGELPLTFCYPQLLGAEARLNSVGLAEGTGAKPNLAAIKMGQQVIGAAGGQWLSSPELLLDGLQRWRADVIDLYLDGEDVHKPQVLSRWVKLYHQLIEWGYKPRLMYSGSDIDELESLNELRSITPLELEQLSGIQLPAPAPEPISLARSLYHQAQKFTPNSTQCNRYLQWEIRETLKNTLIAIKSALGTGKTEILKALGAWARERGLELVFIGYRNNLLRQTADRIPDLYLVIDEDKIILESDYHKALCHHSAASLDPAQMTNKIIILDECVSDLRDMLTSKLTAGRNKDGTDSRQVRLAHIKQLILNCHGVVALDAYLSDTEVNFLRKLRQFDFVHKIENTYKNKMDVRMVSVKSTAIREVLDLALANGGNILVTATTQKFCENLDRALTRMGIPQASIHRFDGTTDRDESVQLFFRNPQIYLEQYKPRVVILSPTAESGISIDAPGYFTTHYHFHLGNLGILSGLQFLGRYRDFTAPRVIFCEEQGRIDEGNSSSFSKWVKDSFDRQVQVDLDLVFALLDKGDVERAMTILNNYTQKEDEWLKLAHQYKASLNEEMRHLKELFIEAMVKDGYAVTLDRETSALRNREDVDGCDDTDDLMGKVEIERRTIHATRLYNAPDIDKRAYEAIKNNATANETERLLASKYYLTQQQLPGIMQTESWSPEMIQMIKYNHPQLIKQLENFYYLLNPALAETNHMAAWLPAVQTESAWLPDQVNRSQLALIKCGNQLGLKALIDQEVSSDSLDKIATAVSDSKLHQSALKISLNPDKPQDPVKLGRKILKKFGLSLVKLRDESYKVEAMKDKTLAFRGAPKYDRLTPELIESVRQLSGREFTGDHPVIQDLGKAMEELGMFDKRGRIRLVAGSARYLGLSVERKRYRVQRGGRVVVTRMYTFSGTYSPISDAIKNTQIEPGTTPVNLLHIHECVSKRLEQLATYQRERITEWKNSHTVPLIGLEAQIHIDDFASISKINLPVELCGSPEFSLENLQTVAQSLLDIGQMEVEQMEIALGEYSAAVGADVVFLAAQMVQSKYPQVFERLKFTNSSKFSFDLD